MQKKTLKRGSRGWGGPWRAYVRAKTLGVHGRPSLAQVGEAYRLDKAQGGDHMDRMIAIGQAATRVGRLAAPAAGHSSFGAKTRGAQRKHLKNLRLACVSQRIGDREQQALDLAQRLATGGSDIATCLSIARSALRHGFRRDKQRQVDIVKALADFAEGSGDIVAQDVKAALPAVRQQRLTPVPWPMGPLFECVPHTPEETSATAAWCRQSKETTLSAELRRFWTSAHKTVMDANSPAIGSVAQGQSPCRLAGVCVCSAEGKMLKKFRNAFIAWMKTVFPPHMPQRAGLLQGRMVVRLRGMPDMTDEDALLDEEAAVHDVYLHVGMQYLSPYRPTFMLLEKDDPGAAESLPAGRLRLKARTRSSVGVPEQPCPIASVIPRTV